MFLRKFIGLGATILLAICLIGCARSVTVTRYFQVNIEEIALVLGNNPTFDGNVLAAVTTEAEGFDFYLDEGLLAIAVKAQDEVVANQLIDQYLAAFAEAEEAKARNNAAEPVDVVALDALSAEIEAIIAQLDEEDNPVLRNELRAKQTEFVRLYSAQQSALEYGDGAQPIIRLVEVSQTSDG